jgi:hypothetical protein
MALPGFHSITSPWRKIMCDPATALAGATIALGGVSAYNQYQSGKYQASVASQNAKATAQANDAINRGNAAAEQRRVQMRQQLGTQVATMGASGADLTSGTALDITGDTAQFGSLDALTTLNNAQREAYGYQVQAANYESGQRRTESGKYGRINHASYCSA